MNFRIRTRSIIAVALSAAPIPLLPAGAQKDAAGGTKDASTLLAESMWAAQTEARAIRLAWNHVAGGATYTISCELGTRPLRVMGPISPGIVTKDVSGLPRRMSYIVQINEPGAVHRCYLQLASDPKGALSARIPFNEVVPIVPGTTTKVAPGSVAAKASGAGEITVTWSEVAGATAYTLGRAVSPSGFRTLCDLCPTTTTFVDRTAQAGVKHTYTVTPMTPAGAFLRGTSNTVTAVATADEVVAGTDPTVNPQLRAPGNVKATVSGPASVMVTWGAVPEAAGYEVFRSANGGALQLMGRVPNGAVGSTIQFPDYLGGYLGAGSNQVTAVYAVKSTDSNGAATQPKTSNEVTIQSKAGVATGTSSTNASNTRATATSSSSVTLTWGPPAGGIACSLQRSLSGGAYAALPALATGASQYIDTAPGLMDQRPRYQILCADPKSQAPVAFPNPVWDVATASPTDRPASTSATAPTNLNAVATSADAVRLTWGPPTSAIACAVRRSISGGAYVVLQLLPLGTWQYVDTSTGLLANKPKYQLSCGDPKWPAPPVAFPIPVWK